MCSKSAMLIFVAGLLLFTHGSCTACISSEETCSQAEMDEVSLLQFDKKTIQASSDAAISAAAEDVPKKKATADVPKKKAVPEADAAVKAAKHKQRVQRLSADNPFEIKHEEYTYEDIGTALGQSLEKAKQIGKDKVAVSDIVARASLPKDATDKANEDLNKAFDDMIDAGLTIWNAAEASGKEEKYLAELDEWETEMLDTISNGKKPQATLLEHVQEVDKVALGLKSQSMAEVLAKSGFSKEAHEEAEQVLKDAASKVEQISKQTKENQQRKQSESEIEVARKGVKEMGEHVGLSKEDRERVFADVDEASKLAKGILDEVSQKLETKAVAKIEQSGASNQFGLLSAAAAAIMTIAAAL